VKLYTFPVAPNPTKVRVYLAEKGLELETERVDLRAAQQRTPEFLAKNPLGKLPVLELDDGSCVCESLAIIEYLEELHPEPSLFGVTPEERAHSRALERLADVGVLQLISTIVHATRSPLGLPAVPEVAAWARARLTPGLKQLDRRLADSVFVAGERVTVADCTLWAALGFGEFGGVEIDPTLANIARWRAMFGGRPSTKLPA
jgi:glutathione S-transferase